MDGGGGVGGGSALPLAAADSGGGVEKAGPPLSRITYSKRKQWKKRIQVKRYLPI